MIPLTTAISLTDVAARSWLGDHYAEASDHRHFRGQNGGSRHGAKWQKCLERELDKERKIP